jgi:zinc transporter ZupT
MPEQLTAVTAHGTLAFFGALVHASKAHREGNSKTFIDFVALTLMSSFSGVMFALIGLYLWGETSYLTMALAGTGGFMGVEGMALIIEKLRQVIERK